MMTQLSGCGTAGKTPTLGYLDWSRWCLLALTLASVSVVQGAQEVVNESDRLFGLTNVWEIRLTTTKANWSAMEPAGGRGPGMPPTAEYPWSTCTFQCAGQTLTNVALRFKGNSSFYSSRGSFKHPFRVDFNRDHKGRAFLGVKGFSLNNNFNDATQFREALAYDACRIAGLTAARTAFAKVYLTISGTLSNEFVGLYTVVEHVDGDFLKNHFGNKKGLLLKPERLRSLEYLGEDWNAYTNRYEPKTEAKPADIRRFIALTKLIAQADDATFERELPGRLDVDGFLRYLAVTAVLANYDSFVGNGHNYYLYQPAEDGKAAFIPWDLNEAFGGHPMAGARAAQADLSVLHPQAGPNRLIERVLANPKWAAGYRRTLGVVLRTACNPARLKAAADQLAHLIEPAVFEESGQAKVAFQRIAVGATNLTAPPQRPGPGGREDLPLAEWITRRMANVTAELAGQRDGIIPRTQNMPGQRGGGPGGPPRERPRAR